MSVMLHKENPIMILRNKSLSLQARAFYFIISCDGYYRPNGMNTTSLVEYFRNYTEENDYKIIDYILELVEKNLIDLE